MPSVYEVFQHWGLKPEEYLKYNGQDNFFSLRNGSKVFFIDASYAPMDPDFHRFGSIQMTRGWCEEIGQMHPKAISALFLTVGRWKNLDYGLKKKMLETCNPHKGYGYHNFYIPKKNNKLPDSKKFITALPQDNKAGDLDYILTLKNNKNKSEYERLFKGNWEYDDDPAVLMGYDVINDLYTNDGIAGDKYLIGDVSRKGSDRFVLGYWEGLQLKEIKEIPYEIKKDIKKSAEYVNKYRKEKGVRLSHTLLDEGGVGGGSVDILGCAGFLGNDKPIQPHEAQYDDNKRVNYANLRAQCAFKFAQLAEAGDVAIYIDDVEIKILISQELEQWKQRDVDKDGKVALIEKKKIKDEIGRSPDFADMLMMRMKFELEDRPKPNIDFID